MNILLIAHSFRKNLLALPVLAAAGLISSLSSAQAVVTYTFGGTVNEADNMGGLVAVGESWTFTVSYDQIPFSGSISPGFGSAEFSQVGTASIFFSGGFSGSFGHGGVGVSHTSSFDFLDFILLSPSFPPVGGHTLDDSGAFFALEADPGTVLTSDALPTTIDPSKFNKPRFTLLWLASFAPDSPFLDLKFTSVTVPDPSSTLPLLGLAFAGMASFRRFARLRP